VNPELVNLATQTQLASLQAAVEVAIANGIPYGELLTVGGWELKFAEAREAGQLPVLVHALAQ
jgi:filamentous hemagglutinin